MGQFAGHPLCLFAPLGALELPDTAVPSYHPLLPPVLPLPRRALQELLILGDAKAELLSCGPDAPNVAVLLRAHGSAGRRLVDHLPDGVVSPPLGRANVVRRCLLGRPLAGPLGAEGGGRRVPEGVFESAVGVYGIHSC